MAKESSKCKDCELLKDRIGILESELSELKSYTQKLVVALEESRRGGKRQAAPFRKSQKEKVDPKKPGRKAGEDHGDHVRRSVPETIDVCYEVPMPKQCDCCGSKKLTRLENQRQQYQTDVEVSVVTRQFNIEVGKCNCCGSAVAGRHALQTSDATGAAGSQLGPWSHSAFALLNKSYGLSYGKIKNLFLELLGVATTRGTIARSVLRTARRCEPTANEIQNEVRGSPSVTPDETGWRVEGHLSDLFTYLRHPGLEATNWRGEQAIRPAVVNRKVWGGNRTWNGARAQGILTSVIQTCRMKSIDPMTQLGNTLSTRKPQQVPALAR